ncbi:MAG: DUF4177 domain-containing protein [Yoonia sp.]|uniref:DUF4177 domain-containing protein n=1 Tax=Yoonia sp. TaxID=2212373 RepID=UPI003EF0E4BD
MSYEYKVVPAPLRGIKAKGLKTPEDRFAHALETAMNTLARDGWEYLRADTLPSEQREGLMSKTTVYQNMLVFRRTKTGTAAMTRKPEPSVAKPVPAITKEQPAEPPKMLEDGSRETGPAAD